MKKFSFTNVLILVAVGLTILYAFALHAADDPDFTWVNDVTTAVNVVLKLNNTTTNYPRIEVCNIVEDTHLLFANKSGTAVPYTSTTESKSIMIPPGFCHKWDLFSQDNTISVACETGQTCTKVKVTSTVRRN